MARLYEAYFQLPKFLIVLLLMMVLFPSLVMVPARWLIG